MAGGKGSRMGGLNEKPLIKICGKSMLKRVIEALKGAKGVDKIVVAVSKYTPKTREEAINLSIDIIDTSGEDYVSDMQYAIKKLHANHVLVLNSDLPLINSDLIDRVLTYYEECGKPALTVVVPSNKLEEIGFQPSLKMIVNNIEVTPVGVNVLNGNYINEVNLEEEIMIIDDVKSLVNVNTINDLKLVERMISSEQSNKC